MSITHVQAMIAALNEGTDPDWLPATLEDYGINEAEVLKIPDSYKLAPMDSYEPQDLTGNRHPLGIMRTTGWLEGMPPISDSNSLSVVGDNGVCSFTFKLIR